MPSGGHTARGYVLRGADNHGVAVRPARMSSDLATSTYVAPGVADPRLVDPLLEAVVEQASMEARARGFRAGHSAGYEAGRQEGMALLLQEIERQREIAEEDRARRTEQLAEMVARIEAAVARELAVQQPTVDDLYDRLAAMTVDLAEALVGHHLSVGDCGAMDAIQRALRSVPRVVDATLRLHPADLAVLEEITGGLTTGVAEWGVTKMVADPSIERAGAVVEIGDLQIDAQLGPAFERVRAVLNPSASDE